MSSAFADEPSARHEQLTFAVTPTTAKALLDAGYDVHVERSPQRMIADSEFEKLRLSGLPRALD